jgi:diguanylate cyclase (GGDEF)-like protein/PAS domain S-box-containing protein
MKRQQVRRLILFFAVLLVVGLTIGYNLYVNYRMITRQEEQRLMTQARVISNNMERQIEATNLVLQGILADLPQIRDRQDREHTNKRLAVLVDAMPGIRTLFFTDAEGTVQASNRPELLDKNFKHRDYFRTPQSQPDQNLLYISPPFKSVLNIYIFNLTRMIPGPDGRFDGVITASVDPEYFTTLLQSVIYAPDMLTTINHGDGVRFMTIPQRDGQAGKNLAVPGSMFSRHQQSGKTENIIIDTAYATGEYRMAALLTMQPAQFKMDKPLVIIISRSPAAITASWKREAIFQGAGFTLFCIVSTALMLTLQRRQTLFERQTRKSADLVQLRYHLLEFATTHTVDELLSYALDQICLLSDSPVGFYHLVDADQQGLTLQAWSTRTLEEFCQTEGKGMHYGLDQAGVWADCVQTRAPVIHNDYASLPHKKGLPQGHAQVIRELVVPVIRDERIVAILAMGNKPTDYTPKDAEEVLYLADVTWEIIETHRAQEELARSRQELADIFDFLPDATFVVDQEVKVIAWNQAMEQMSGVPKQAILGQGDYAYTVPFYGDRRPNLLNMLEVDDASLANQYENITRKGESLNAEAFCPALNDGTGASIWVICAPLHDTHGKRIGAIESIRDISAIKQLEAKLKQSNDLLKSQARIDFLTGVYNRLMFDKLLHAEMQRVRRYDGLISLIMFDLDHFKKINDTLGHNTGDHVLKTVADLVAGRIRSHDVLCRWGGEEFMVLAPKNDAAQAAQLAEILRGLIEGHDFGDGLQVTASFGVTSHICGESVEVFVNRVDTALYQAKNDGRNRVAVG